MCAVPRTGPVSSMSVRASIRRLRGSGTIVHRPPSFYFSRGSGEDRVKVPDVRGMDLDDAVARLRAAGFTTDVGERVRSRRYERGTVAEMSPGPGSVEPGTTITLRPSVPTRATSSAGAAQ